MSTNSSRYIKISVNGNQLANVIGVETFLKREHTIEGNTLSVQNSLITAKIKRQKILGDSRNDGINLRSLSKFTLAISYPGLNASFDDCEWIEFKETISEDGIIIEDITAISTKYSTST